MYRGRALLALASALLVMAPTAALAHRTEGVGGGLVSGFLHPILGPDHLVAMVAVGLWGAQLGRPLLIVLPLTFPLVMAFGGLLGVLKFPLPGVELGISVSALVLGLVVAFAYRAPVWLAVTLIGVFAIFHGYAHGEELPRADSPIAYGIGFVVSTGLLHLAGVAIGQLNEWKETGPLIVRGCGVLIAAGGVYFVSTAIGIA